MVSAITSSTSGGVLWSDPSMFFLSTIEVSSVGLPRKAWATIGARGTTQCGVRNGQFGPVLRRKVFTDCLDTSREPIVIKNLNRHLQDVHRN